MSLFAGINFRSDPNSKQPNTPSGSATPSLPPSNKEPSTSTPSSAAAPAPWSAALRFAPAAASRRSKPTAAAPSSSTTVYQKADQPTPQEETASSIPSSHGHQPPPPQLPQSISSTFSAQPTTTTAPTAPIQTDFPTSDAQGRKVFKPPAMTIEAGARDGAGGAGSGAAIAGRKRPAEMGGEWNGGRSKKKGKKNAPLFSNPEQPPFDPHEPYNPSRPTDLMEYKAYRKAAREERSRKAKAEQARKMSERGGSGIGIGGAGTGSGSKGKGYGGYGRDSDDESSYYSEDEEEERRDAVGFKAKGWAPPAGLYDGGGAGAGSGSGSGTGIGAPAFRRPPPQDENDEYGSYTNPSSSTNPSFPSTSQPPAFISAPAPQQPQSTAAMSGEEAYQRRLALSQLKTETADQAYARRAAMSSGGGGVTMAATPAFASSSGTSYNPVLVHVPPPSTSHGPAAAHTETEDLGDFVPLDDDYDDYAQPVAAPAPPPLTISDPEDFAKKLEERKAAAAAIAARFAAIAPPKEEAEDLVERMAREVEKETADNSGIFAEKMMRRWGHEEGKGLGKEGTGMIHAFSAEHVSPSSAISNKKGASKAKSDHAGKWVQSSSSKGRLVNLNEDERKKEEKEKYGEPSTIVCLTNIVAKVEEADEDLSAEIAEECNKNGIVERVVLHAVTPPPENPSEGLRIFVQFSGLAGAWRTLKEMDGRFFGGRQISAKYFNEGRFTRGDRDGKIL